MALKVFLSGARQNLHDDINKDGIKHLGQPHLADDGKPYTVIGYLNGPGSVLQEVTTVPSPARGPI